MSLRERGNPVRRYEGSTAGHPILVHPDLQRRRLAYNSFAGVGKGGTGTLKVDGKAVVQLPTNSSDETANWNADSDNRWTIPIGGGVGKIIHFGKLPVSMQLSGYDNAGRPEFGADWQIRAQFQLMFPK